MIKLFTTSLVVIAVVSLLGCDNLPKNPRYQIVSCGQDTAEWRRDYVTCMLDTEKGILYGTNASATSIDKEDRPSGPIHSWWFIANLDGPESLVTK